MERLTNRFSNGEAFIPNYVSDLYGKGKVAEKLAYYEDLEEQGRLIELPCKVGDTVYQVSTEYGKCPYSNEDLDYDCEDYDCFSSCICANKGVETIIEMEAHSLEWVVMMREKFGEIYFLTREEAEQALAEMKEV